MDRHFDQAAPEPGLVDQGARDLREKMGWMCQLSGASKLDGDSGSELAAVESDSASGTAKRRLLYLRSWLTRTSTCRVHEMSPSVIILLFRVCTIAVCTIMVCTNNNNKTSQRG